LPEDRSVFQPGDSPVPPKTLCEMGLGAEDADEAFLQAAHLAEGRVAQAAAAIVKLGADDDAIRARLEKRLSQRHEQLRERLLLSSTQTLEALDRALEVARAGGAHSLVADVAPARALLAAIAEDYRGDAPSFASPGDTLEIEAPTLADSPALHRDEGDPGAVGATLVVADSESLFVRPSPRERPVPRAARPPNRVPQAGRPTPPVAPPPRVLPASGRSPSRNAVHRRPLVGVALLGIAAVAAGALAIRMRDPRPEDPPVRVNPVEPRPPIDISPVPTPTPHEDITVVREGGTAPKPIPTPAIIAPEPITKDPDPVPSPPDPVPPVPVSVEDMMAEGARAEASKDYDTAVARYSAVLAIDPGHAEAATGLLRAKGARAALGRFFQTQATVRDVAKADEKQCEWGPCAKARVLDCKLEYAITPAVPGQGEPYRIDVTAVNTGEKSLKIQSPTALLFRNGAQAPHPLDGLGSRDIARGEKKPIARIEDIWMLGTTSWWLEVTVKDQKGDSYRAQVTWELPRAPSR
jgi:hypothetical protein